MTPRRFFLRLTIALLLCASSAAAGDKNKNKNIVYRTEGLVADVAGVSDKVIDAKRQCGNYSWAAAAETLLRAQGADISQTAWVVKVFGGDKCMDTGLDFADMAQKLTGDYALAKGEKIQIATEWQPGPPVNVDALIAGLMQGRLYMMCWKSHAYIVAGITYDREISARTGNRVFYIREIRLIDPLMAKNVPQRQVKFVRDQDEPKEIDGILTVAVSERKY